MAFYKNFIRMRSGTDDAAPAMHKLFARPSGGRRIKKCVWCSPPGGHTTHQHTIFSYTNERLAATYSPTPSQVQYHRRRQA